MVPVSARSFAATLFGAATLSTASAVFGGLAAQEVAAPASAPHAQLLHTMAGSPEAVDDATPAAAEPARRCGEFDDKPASGFPQPEVRESAKGVLRTSLVACIGKNKVLDAPSGEMRVIKTTTYEGAIPGPTFVVKPGDRLLIDLTNNLPPNPTGLRDGMFPHEQNSTNFHSHGLTVSPLGNSDNAYRLMPPGSTNRVKIDIPADHPTGTYWYHPHKHGSTTFQFLGGMSGFLIIKGGKGTLDAVPEVAAAKDLVMGFQVIRTAIDGTQPFVHQDAEQFGTFPFFTTDVKQQGVWSTYGLDGAPGRSFFYFTTNGVTNPTVRMRPGEVQRWRMLNASASENLMIDLEGHGLNIVAMDGITVSKMYQLKPGEPFVMGPGQRMDVMVKAGDPGTYRLLSEDPSAVSASVSPSGKIGVAPRNSRHSFDFPSPCAAPAPVRTVGIVDLENAGPNHVAGHGRGQILNASVPAADDPCAKKKPSILAFPFPLATIVVDGKPMNMKLPSDPLPVPEGLPTVAKMLKKTPDVRRNVAFELCGMQEGTIMARARNRLPSCGWYFEKYADIWGGKPFVMLQMMRDADDTGVANDDKEMPLIDFKKDGLFNPNEPLFDGMVAGNYEEWTVTNRTYSDHPFHIHQNPFLVTHINGRPLDQPEWHDTLIVPGTIRQPTNFLPPPAQPNINKIRHGSITFRIYFNPITVGCFVMHCHILSHEDLGMMQRLDVLPGKDQPSVCPIGPSAQMEH
jgi:FtsP/CotA-like multicopper oxidase with cupredoxin domain